MTATQESLLPAEEIEWTDQEIILEALPHTQGSRPNRAMIDSVAAIGVVHPVVLVHDGDQFQIVDGRRRIAAAREAKLATIPARVATVDSWRVPTVIGLILNEQRSENAYVDMVRILTLTRRGHSPQEIAAATGKPISTIKRLQKLANLNAALMSGFETGAISRSVASAAASLPPTKQKELAEVLVETGKLTMQQVEDVKRVRRDEGMVSLWDSLPDNPLEEDWRLRVRRHLQEALDEVPPSNLVAATTISTTMQYFEVYDESVTSQEVPF